MKLEIIKRLKAARGSLNLLGIERDTTEKQRRYVLDIVTKFQDLVSAALMTNYGGDIAFKGQPDLRLPTKLASRNDEFSEQMQYWGQHSWFCDGDISTEDVDSGPKPVETNLNAKDLKKTTINVRTVPSNLEVEEILYDQKSLPKPLDNIIDWLEDEYQRSRGFELGTFSSSLLSTVMKTQSRKWPDLAMGYISDAVVIVHKFILQLLRSACTDEKVRAGLLSIIMDDLFDRYKKAIAHVSFLLNVERFGTQMTQNHYFNDTLEKWYD